MSLASLLYRWGVNRPNSPFIGSLTYSQVSKKVAGLARSLPTHGVIAHFMFNSPEAIMAYLAGFWAGTKVIAIDPLTSSEDLAYILNDSKPDVILVDEEIAEREKSVLTSFRFMIPKFNEEINAKPYEYDEDEPGLSYYYAGIAGRTMEVIHSAQRVELNSRILYQSLGLSEIRTILTVPLAHVLGGSVLGVTLEAGGLIVPVRKFSASGAIEIINTYKVNYLATVPMVYDSLIQQGGSISSLEVCISTAAPLFPSTVNEFKQRFGKNIIQQYGFTEGLVVTLQPKEFSDRITIGSPLKGAEIKIIKEDGSLAREGEVGDLWVKAPWLMLGYKDRSETARVMEGDWLKTGDLVSVDSAGLLYFKGVKKRMLKYKGYPIFPRDLEIILESHPAVQSTRVIGEDAGNLGQQPVAYVVLKKGYNISSDELLEYVNQKVAFYKRLKKVYIVEKLE